ncbi:MAG: hypothetical protein AAGE52_17740 [Myxococcota bacterium]
MVLVVASSAAAQSNAPASNTEVDESGAEDIRAATNEAGTETSTAETSPLRPVTFELSNGLKVALQEDRRWSTAALSSSTRLEPATTPFATADSLISQST